MDILTCLKEVSDSRQQSKIKYELSLILLFSIFAICSKADTFRKIAIYISSHFNILKESFGLSWESTPAYTTIRNVLNSSGKETLEESFRKNSLSEIREKTQLTIHVDGKTLRGSLSKDKAASQVLNAFVSQTNSIIAHEFIEENKTNEIPKAQKMIKELGLKNCLYTFDAMHTQRETLKVIKQFKCDAIFQVKGNQEALLSACINRASVNTCHSYNKKKEKSHGRREKREVWVYNNFCGYNKKIKKLWKGIKQIIMVKRTIDSQIEYSYYISTKRENAKYYQKIVRSHWEVESTDHYVRDVALNEDKSKIRINPEICATLRSFAFNILSKLKPKKITNTDFMYYLTLNPHLLLLHSNSS